MIDKIFLRLPHSLQKDFQRKCSSLYCNGKEPDFVYLMEFIQQQAMLSNTRFANILHKANYKYDSSIKRSSTHSTMVETSTEKCLICTYNHPLWRCDKFRAMPVKERRKFVQTKGLCFNCLKGNHIARKCSSTVRCKTGECGKAHHTLLHDSTWKSSASQFNHAPNDSVDGMVASTTLSDTPVPKVWLKVVPVEVWHENGRKMIKTYAFLDEGSTSTLCSQSLARHIGIHGREENMVISTVNGQQRRKVIQLDLNVKGVNETRTLSMKGVLAVRSLPQLTSNIPSSEDVQRLPHLQGLAFPSFKSKVDLLIGADNLEAHEIQDIRKGSKGQPTAKRTILGWALVGKEDGLYGTTSSFFTQLAQGSIQEECKALFSCEHCDEDTGDQLAPSIDDQYALSIMETCSRSKDGHFVIHLPWKNNEVTLPSNRKLAVNRISYLKKRFERDPQYFRKYKEKIDEYLSSGYARKVPDDYQPKYSGRDWYIPHHATGKKFRVVFDCAAKYEGTSLNENLLQGPDYTNSLVGILNRFRQEAVAFSCDIKAMYHQVKVHPDDINSLKFLWWPDNDLSKDPVDHQMLVHLFGAKSSPSCAGYALKRTATDNHTNASKETIEVVKTNFYVDDCVCSVKTTKDALMLIEELEELLLSSGFQLSKYRSNCHIVCLSIPENRRSSKNDASLLDKQSSCKTLGIIWDTEFDRLKIKVNIGPKPTTRRGILSVISQVFDPLGIVQPYTFPVKRLLQQLCSQRFGWDDQIPEQLRSVWYNWLDQLPHLQSISISRSFKPKGFVPISTQLHIFCDASEQGFGTVAYLRFVASENVIHCTLVMAKSRVAPMKTRTIPRLELSAALLGVQLSKLLLQELNYEINNVYFWTDSTVVLQYINNDHKRFHTYVANRLVKIHNGSTPNQWNHVSSDNNPADFLTRGMTAKTHTGKLNMWFNGPAFLWKSENNWPKSFPLLPLSSSDANVKGSSMVLQTDSTKFLSDTESWLSKLGTRHSNWLKLQKMIAWLLMFKRYCITVFMHKQKFTLKGHLTTCNLEEAALIIIKDVQEQCFPRLMTSLAKHETIAKGRGFSSPELQGLLRLAPFLHKGIMRVGGRLHNSHLDFDTKHPIILPRNNHVCSLVINYYHVREGHAGTLHVLSALREKYWIIQGQAAVRSVIRKCIHCQFQRSQVGSQMMASLPPCRVTPYHPAFTWTGIDYMGPFAVKVLRSNLKRYVAVFTCLASRAIHLEVSYGLDTSSFLMAFRRFTGRRGKPKAVYSDNGTNFIGADRELKSALKEWNQSVIHHSLLQQHIDWHFNPPGASHQGGVWERVIRTVRKVLYAITKGRMLNDETLHTFLVEVERIVNNRPITPLSDDISDSPSLTPNSLLTGRLQFDGPPGSFVGADGYRRSWKLTQFLSDQFWSQWSKLYMLSLQQRQKWTMPKRNFRVGDVVLIVNEQTKRSFWPKGVIKETFPGSDGLVRRVRVTTANASLIRDVRKLCRIEDAN